MFSSALVARLAGWPRRCAVLVCLLLAAVTYLSPAPVAARTETVDVVVAAHSLSAGHPIGTDDLRVAAWPSRGSPPGSFTGTAALLGRRTAGPIAAGEAITTTRLAGAGLTVGLPAGSVAVTVAVASSVAGVVRPGDRVELLLATSNTTGSDSGSDAGTPSADGSPGAPVILARSVIVLAVLPADSGTSSDATLVIAVDEASGARLAAYTAQVKVAVVIYPP